MFAKPGVAPVLVMGVWVDGQVPTEEAGVVSNDFSIHLPKITKELYL